MNPDARTLWQAPSWGLAVLLACLGMLGPFSIDTYLPAFTGIAHAIGASPVQMQQTLSAYLFGFAVMNLFHGALSDSFGRRPVCWADSSSSPSHRGLRLVAARRPARVLSSGPGHVRGRRHRHIAGRDPRHVPAGRRPARDVAGDDLLRRRTGDRADGRRLALHPCRLAHDLLVPDRGRHRALARDLASVAGDTALDRIDSRSMPATSCVATGSSGAIRASSRWHWRAASPSTACSSTSCRPRSFSAITCIWRRASSSGSSC